MSTLSIKRDKASSAPQFFRQVPCGARLPDSIHAVSVSMPVLQDLIDYERGDAEAIKRIPTGYPRFHTHPYVARIQDYMDEKLRLDGRPLLVVSSLKVAHALSRLVDIDAGEIVQYKNLVGIITPPDRLARAKAFRQHIGAHISSRQAEDFLIEDGLLERAEVEERAAADGEGHIRRTLRAAYDAAGEDDVFLANAGMNAVYSAYKSINTLQNVKGKNIWIQFGWLFMDTMRLVEKLRDTGTDYHTVYDVSKLDELRRLLNEMGDRVAGIITEAPSNPLLRTPDVREIKRLAEQHDCALIIDGTLGTPYNVDVLPHADIVIESLTKYANGAADVMMGAVVLNAASGFYQGVRAALPDFLEQPYVCDVNRLAFRISGYAERMRKVNANTVALVDFLKTRKSVKRIFWAYQDETRANYEKIQRASNSPGGIISVELNVPLAPVYDGLRIAKGPSLGAEFTLVGPYLYHAHYDLVSSETGRDLLCAAGLNPDLLRISVGVEPIEDLVQIFSEVL
jgi:cystathionine beta-lyase/cystathionine gamma-synthase